MLKNYHTETECLEPIHPGRLVKQFQDIEDALATLKGAYADNTLRAYRTDLSNYWGWCKAHRVRCIPTEAELLVRYIAEIKEGSRPATIRRRISAIGRVHHLMGYGDPTKDETVRLELRRMHREKGRRQKQALGMTADIRDAIIGAATENRIGLRDRLLVSIAYDTLRRSSELVQLRVEDITPAPEGGAVILVRQSKTDQERKGHLAYLSARTMVLLKEWLKETGIREGFLLRSVRVNEEIGESLYPRTIGRIFKKLATSAGLSQSTVRGLSGHSARVGAAQDMAAAGIDLIAIMQAGGWKEPSTVSRYIENLDVLRGGSYRLAMIQSA